MSDSVHIAVLQCALPGPAADNIERIETTVRDAAKDGAQVILTPELFESAYFPQTKDKSHFDLARPAAGHPTIEHFAQLAKELAVVLPFSFFERAGRAFFNSVAILDADGTNLGIYRKTHIPDGPGYEEKFYFQPGNSGFRVWNTAYAKIGVGICWDQWFPECARSMALQGAELLLYPSTIGSEPNHPELDTKPAWQRVMIGQAVANSTPIAAANRVGREANLNFYGGSFVCNGRGDRLVDLGDQRGIGHAVIDLEAERDYREMFGLLKDCEPKG